MEVDTPVLAAQLVFPQCLNTASVLLTLRTLHWLRLVRFSHMDQLELDTLQGSRLGMCSFLGPPITKSHILGEAAP